MNFPMIVLFMLRMLPVLMQGNQGYKNSDGNRGYG